MIRFKNLGIGKKLGLCLGGIIVLVGGVSLKSWVGFERVHGSFEDYQKSAQQSAAAEELRIAISDFIGLAKEYVARNTEARYRRALEAYESVQDRLKNAARHTNGSYGDALKGASAAVTDLRQTFEDFVGARRERNTVVERVRHSLAKAIEAADRAAGDALGRPAHGLLRSQDLLRQYLDNPSPDLLARTRGLAGDAAVAARNSIAAGTVEGLVAEFQADLGRIDHLLSREADLANSMFGERMAASRATALRMIEATRAIEQRSAQAFVAEKQSAELMILLGGLAALISAIGIVFLLTRSIARPIRAMTDSMRQLASNNLEVRVSGEGRGDEIGAMATAMQTFIEMAQERRRLEEDQKQSWREQQRRQDEIDQLIGMFGRSIGGMLKQIEAASNGMASTSEEMLGTARTNMKRADRVQSSTQRVHDNATAVAAAAEQLRNSVSEIARQIHSASLMSGEVATNALHSERTVDALSDGVMQVTDVVQLIRSISERTNLLALNATIEAARAGEAGKGFAVVAAEVKSLANQTTRATDDIQKVIESIGVATKEAVDAMRVISGKIAELDTVSQSVAAATLQQGEATAEIARSVHQVTADLDGVRQDVAGVHESGVIAEHSSESVRVSASSLADEAAILATEVRNFLDGISKGERRDRLQRRDVRLPVVVRSTNGSIKTHSIRLSPASIEVEGRLNVPPGLKLQISIDGLGDVHARLAQQDDSTSVLQLPLNQEHLDQMCAFIDRVAA